MERIRGFSGVDALDKFTFYFVTYFLNLSNCMRAIDDKERNAGEF